MELSNSGCFQTLVDAVQQEKLRKAMLQETILKEEAGRKRMKLLQRQLTDVKKEKEIEIQQRNEMIAHLKDQLQVWDFKITAQLNYWLNNAFTGKTREKMTLLK